MIRERDFPMQCQIEPLDLLSRQNVLLCTFNRIHPNEGTFEPLHPDDLKGLRDWVFAKRVEEIKTRENHLRMYSAPWRVG
jgi:hypothetical protein